MIVLLLSFAVLLSPSLSCCMDTDSPEYKPERARFLLSLLKEVENNKHLEQPTEENSSVTSRNNDTHNMSEREIWFLNAFGDFEDTTREINELLQEALHEKSSENQAKRKDESPNDILKLYEAIVEREPDEQLSNIPMPEPTRWIDYKYKDYGFPD